MEKLCAIRHSNNQRKKKMKLKKNIRIPYYMLEHFGLACTFCRFTLVYCVLRNSISTMHIRPLGIILCLEYHHGKWWMTDARTIERRNTEFHFCMLLVAVCRWLKVDSTAEISDTVWPIHSRTHTNTQLNHHHHWSNMFQRWIEQRKNKKNAHPSNCLRINRIIMRFHVWRWTRQRTSELNKQ